MTGLPVFTIADLESRPAFDVTAFTNDDAVDLGLIAVAVIRERGADLAVRIVLRGDVVFAAKLGTTGPGNDAWLAGKAAVAERFGEPSLLVRRRREAADLPKSDDTEPDLRFYGGAVPIRVTGEIVGTLTASGEPDVVDHDIAAEAIRRYLAR